MASESCGLGRLCLPSDALMCGCHPSRHQDEAGLTAPVSLTSGADSMLWSSAAGPLLLLAAEASAEAAASGDTGYSQNSYNATLFLFVLCFPGLYSLVKRSAKSKVRDEKGVAECAGNACCRAESTLTLSSLARPCSGGAQDV